MQQITAIALSGGIDSLVAAALLKEQGHQLIAIHFITGYEVSCTPTPGSGGDLMQALTIQAEHRLGPLARKLQIPMHFINAQRDFQRHVVDYFISEYRNGKTPNPCLVCNPKIKFDLLLKSAKALGATGIATGHYARVLPDAHGGFRLLRGVDGLKDQSYFLARLTQDQLKHIVLPLGNMTKAHTRRLADAIGLQPVSDRESQDICFIPGSSYGEFLSGRPGFEMKPGPIETVTGEVIGSHRGIHLFTIGQRKGINCPAAAPYYVVRIDPVRNCVVVGRKEELLTLECHIAKMNWIGSIPPKPLRVMTKVRYRHAAVAATLFPVDPTSARVVFDRPQQAVTPGQGAVFFEGEEVLGGGWIT